MFNPELEPYNFFQLLHAFLRDEASEAEIQRTNQIVEWAQRQKKVLASVLDETEMNLLRCVMEHHYTSGYCPTRESMNVLVENASIPKPLQTMLVSYDKFAPNFQKITHADMDVYLQLRIDDYEKVKLIRMLNGVAEIASGSVPDPYANTKDAPQLSGVKDALKYMAGKVGNVLVKGERAEGGQLSEHAGQIQENYDKTHQARLNGTLFIPTGIPIIDTAMGGLRRKEMSGILGYVGQRKTAVLRTMAYRAAEKGLRVLHIPLESDFDQELTAYHIMHAHTVDPDTFHTMTTQRYDDGELTDAEYAEFFGTVKPHFAETVGQNLVVYDPKGDISWTSIRAAIERENDDNLLDLILIDYLTLVSGDPKKDSVTAMAEVVQDAKQLTLHLGEKGIAFVTPIQGNRDGYEQATGNDGAWEIVGVSTYSSLDKSLDNCFYVYTNDVMSAAGQLKMGTCKRRRGPNLPATSVPLNLAAGMLAGSPQDTTITNASKVDESMPSDEEIRDGFNAIQGEAEHSNSHSSNAIFDYMAH